jgi:hypothetical protein
MIHVEKDGLIPGWAIVKIFKLAKDRPRVRRWERFINFVNLGIFGRS